MLARSKLEAGMRSIELDEPASLHHGILLRPHHSETLIEVDGLDVFLVDIEGEPQGVFIQEVADELTPNALTLALDSHSNAHQVTGTLVIPIQVTGITHYALGFCLARDANAVRGRLPKLLQNIGVLFEKLWKGLSVGHDQKREDFGLILLGLPDILNDNRIFLGLQAHSLFLFFLFFFGSRSNFIRVLIHVKFHI